MCLPIGVFSRFGEIADVRVEVTVDGEELPPFSTDDGGGIEVVRPAFVQGAQQQYRDHEPWRLLDVRHHRVEPRPRCSPGRRAEDVPPVDVPRRAERRARLRRLREYSPAADQEGRRPPGHLRVHAARERGDVRAGLPDRGPGTLGAGRRGRRGAGPVGSCCGRRTATWCTCALISSRRSSRTAGRRSVHRCASRSATSWQTSASPATSAGRFDRVLLPLLDREARHCAAHRAGGEAPGPDRQGPDLGAGRSRAAGGRSGTCAAPGPVRDRELCDPGAPTTCSASPAGPTSRRAPTCS